MAAAAVVESESVAAKRFLTRNPENADLNQYWYSAKTIDVLVSEIEELCQPVSDQKRRQVAFVSTPSLWFSLRDKELKDVSKFFDIDLKWKENPNFVYYDFREPEKVDEALHGTFDLVVVDPPFITRDAYEKYATSVKLLLAEGGKVIVSTIDENAAMLEEMMQLKLQKFQPSIPNLVYQYSMFCNYESERLSQRNPEIPE